MDAYRLIAEVKQRPLLWDVKDSQYQDRTLTPLMWQEVADALGTTVDNCKRKWKNLRDAYRAEVRRHERRRKTLMGMGHSNDESEAKVRRGIKWAYFEPLSFINDSKRFKYNKTLLGTETQTRMSASVANESEQITQSDESSDEVKLEEPSFETHEANFTPDEEDAETDALMQEFNCVATPQNARRFSDSLGLSNELETNNEDNNVATTNVFDGPSNTAGRSTTATAAAAAAACKCSKRDDQWHFLEDLEREEQKLIKSTRQDITRIATTHPDHVGDADYNFLVSFLPHMKKMSQMQNLYFRSKMSELLLHTMKGGCTVPTSVAASLSSMLDYKPERDATPELTMKTLSPTQQRPRRSTSGKSANGYGTFAGGKNFGDGIITRSAKKWT